MKKIFLSTILLVLTYQVLGQQPQLLVEKNHLVTPLGGQIMVSAPDGLGNILYSGVVAMSSSNKLENKFLLVKPNGDTLWTWKNPQKLDSETSSLQAIGPGKFLAGGNIISGTSLAMSLQRINSNKTFSWAKNYTSVPSMIMSKSMVPLSGKDLLVGGGYQHDFAFTRIDSAGNVKWSRSHSWGGSIGDNMVDMKMAKNGNIIALGSTDQPYGPQHIKVMLINQNGDSLLGRQLIVNGINRNESVSYTFNSVLPLSDGGYLLTARLDTFTNISTAMGMVVKLDGNLNIQWKYVHRNPSTDFYVFTKAKELMDHSILVLGFKYWPKQSSNGFQLYRFSPQGTLMATYPFTSSNSNPLLITTFDALPDSTFMVGGGSIIGNNPSVSYGFYVAKVKIPGLPLPLPPVNISGVQEELLAENGLGQSYPNPTAAEAIIPYNLPKNCRQASIIIREIATGREVKSYALKRNESSLKVDLSNFSNGLYLYSLVVDEKPIATKKLAVMK